MSPEARDLRRRLSVDNRALIRVRLAERARIEALIAKVRAGRVYSGRAA